MDNDMRLLHRYVTLYKSSYQWILGVLLLSLFYNCDGERSSKVCDSETFNVSCSQNEVIKMTSARFGRMELGKCTPTNLGFLGCYANVLKYMDSVCSGNRECIFRIYDTTLKNEPTTCPIDVAHYLEAEYRCIKVATGDATTCHVHNHIPLTGNSHGVLASVTTQTRGLGGAQCPWRISVSDGQTVQVALYDFADESRTVIPSNTALCQELAVIREHGKNDKAVFRCQDTARYSIVHTSVSNTVTIEIRQDPQQNTGTFLLEYKAIGCADPPENKNTFVQRDGDTLIVRCNSTDRTWYLVCSESEWVGTVEECAGENESVTNRQGSNDDDYFPIGILIVVAIGVALGVFLGGLLLTLVHLHMKRRTAKLRRMQYMSAATAEEIVPAPDTVDVIADCAQCTLERSKDEKPPPFTDPTHEIKSYDGVKEYTVYMGKPMTAKHVVGTKQGCPFVRPHFYEQPKFI